MMRGNRGNKNGKEETYKGGVSRYHLGRRAAVDTLMQIETVHLLDL